MAKKKEVAPEEEILVLHEKWVRAAREHLREIIIVSLVLVFLASLWAFYNYYRQKRLDEASLLYARALMVRDVKQKRALLAEVVRKYGNTSAGMEARLSLFEMDFKNGELEKALEELNQVYRKAKKPLKIFVLLGRGYVEEERNRLNEARAAYQEAAEAKIGLEEVAYLDLARVAELQGNYKEAVNYYQKLIALKPQGLKIDFIQVKLDEILEKIGQKSS